MRVTNAQQKFQVHTQKFIRELARLQREMQGKSPQEDQLLNALRQAIRMQSGACLDCENELQETQLIRAAQIHYQSQIDPWFRLSWFMDRAKKKPRGYPGDYITLTGIYDNQPKSDGFGGYLDLYFLQSDLARAVRARMESARQFIGEYVTNAENSIVRILNVASGPCREYLVGLEYPSDSQVEITCIDSDAESLCHVQEQVAKAKLRPSIKFVNYNALRLRSAKRNREIFGQPDVIYSVGLLDYIPDRHLIPLLQGLRQTVRPGGTVFFAFKDELQYDKAEYQWFVDWFFFQRTESECLWLLEQAGFDSDTIEVTRDETGIIMNFIGQVSSTVSGARFDTRHFETRGPAGVRVDQTESLEK